MRMSTILLAVVAAFALIATLIWSLGRGPAATSPTRDDAIRAHPVPLPSQAMPVTSPDPGVDEIGIAQRQAEEQLARRMREALEAPPVVRSHEQERLAIEQAAVATALAEARLVEQRIAEERQAAIVQAHADEQARVEARAAAARVQSEQVVPAPSATPVPVEPAR